MLITVLCGVRISRAVPLTTTLTRRVRGLQLLGMANRNRARAIQLKARPIVLKGTGRRRSHGLWRDILLSLKPSKRGSGAEGLSSELKGPP